MPEEAWLKKAREHLLGRKIVAVRWMSTKEADEMGWSSRPIVLQLNDGNVMYPSMDDEGNDGGALFTNEETFPVMRNYL